MRLEVVIELIPDPEDTCERCIFKNDSTASQVCEDHDCTGMVWAIKEVK